MGCVVSLSLSFSLQLWMCEAHQAALTAAQQGGLQLVPGPVLAWPALVSDWIVFLVGFRIGLCLQAAIRPVQHHVLSVLPCDVAS